MKQPRKMQRVVRALQAPLAEGAGCSAFTRVSSRPIQVDCHGSSQALYEEPDMKAVGAAVDLLSGVRLCRRHGAALVEGPPAAVHGSKDRL